MFQEYNATLRNLGDTTFREASVEVKMAGGKAVDKSRSHGYTNVKIAVDRVSGNNIGCCPGPPSV